MLGQALNCFHELPKKKKLPVCINTRNYQDRYVGGENDGRKQKRDESQNAKSSKISMTIFMQLT